MKKTFYKTLGQLSVLSMLSINIALAVPWCHLGTKVQIADVSWDEASIVANYPGSIPGDIPPWIVGNTNMHITFMSVMTYANTFAGGGGGFGGYSVPNSGQVRQLPYAPHNYITAPSLYNISQGVSFKLEKCYTIPPMIAVSALEMIAPDPGGDGPTIAVEYTPLRGLDQICDYLKIVDPDDDEDYDEDEGNLQRNDVTITSSCR